MCRKECCCSSRLSWSSWTESQSTSCRLNQSSAQADRRLCRCQNRYHRSDCVSCEYVQFGAQPEDRSGGRRVPLFQQHVHPSEVVPRDNPVGRHPSITIRRLPAPLPRNRTVSRIRVTQPQLKGSVYVDLHAAIHIRGTHRRLARRRSV